MAVLYRLLCVPLLILAALLCSSAASANADCPAESRITHDFDNGARWDLCWESRIRENLVLSDIHYTPPDKESFRVLGSARLSQLHVAYDDSDITYNDITQYGLGGSYLLSLTQADCPTGELLTVQTRPALCLWQTSADSGYSTASSAARAASINLFSVSQVGAYAYVISWTFYDNGSFEPAVGATGALQRSSESIDLPFGRVLEGDPDTLWLSHTHNYYWRLDFDLGASANDDKVSELSYTTDSQGRRELNTQVFDTEQARRIDPDSQRLWRILDDKTSSGYQLEPARNGHRFERKEIEPHTDYDFFITVGNNCERFASQNARFNPDCLNDVLQFVDGQSIQDEDIVVWNRVSFHHTPRSEDQRSMHTHWDGFMITPVNVLDGTSALAGSPNTAPRFPALPNLQSTLGELIHADLIRADDADGDVLSYSASGLPPGLEIRPDGHIHGNPLEEGRYLVVVTAYDDHEESQANFMWTVGDPVNASTRKSGKLSPWSVLIMLATWISLLIWRSKIMCHVNKR
ncbi:MAG: hypothetical protein AB8B87_21095 [Granulosicoccus sp.]